MSRKGEVSITTGYMLYLITDVQICSKVHDMSREGESLSRKFGKSPQQYTLLLSLDNGGVRDSCIGCPDECSRFECCSLLFFGSRQEVDGQHSSFWESAPIQLITMPLYLHKHSITEVQLARNINWQLCSIYWSQLIYITDCI
jgi:hypothetical protein